MAATPDRQRTLGLVGATGVGVGAIVGGGILALAGVAFSTTGPSAIIAFALNGVIAVVTALSFAELSSMFPQSGGTYTFARRVLNVEAAFGVGWVVWFASIVAAVLYAVGFAAFAAPIIGDLWNAFGGDPLLWLADRWAQVSLALGATLVYGIVLARTRGGGGSWINITKVIVFLTLILGGAWAMTKITAGEVSSRLSPFFAEGGLGLIQAMGYTFIALQGFDLIAAVAGEVKDPRRTLPRAMLASLGIALLIYLPLLLVIATVGVTEDQHIRAASEANPETIVALAARQFLGGFGYWLVNIAAVLSMLSALQANLYAASRVASSMARDRNLPFVLARRHPERGIPVYAVIVTCALVAMTVLLIGDVAAAGAAASLIFLATFTLAQLIAVLARKRGDGSTNAFRTPWFPLAPVVGATACLGLGIFQAFAVPSAGIVAGGWLGLGFILFLALFARRARVVDALSEARDPQLLRFRGRSPLVLVPLANPAHARAMVGVADALSPPAVGRVMLLTVVPAPQEWQEGETPPTLARGQAVLREALVASFARQLAPEALTTIATSPWSEIPRVARLHDCESVLVGLSDLDEHADSRPLEQMLSALSCDTVVLRAPDNWELADVRRVLVPIGGRGRHDELRARLLGSLQRTGEREVLFLRVLPEGVDDGEAERARRDLLRLAQDEAPHISQVIVVRSGDIPETLARHAAECDLILLGMHRVGRRGRAFGEVSLRIARETAGAVILIGHRG